MCTHTLNYLLTKKFPILAVQISELQAEEVLLWDHGWDIFNKFVHAHCFNIALLVPCFVSNDKTANLQVFDLLGKPLIGDIGLWIVISMHHKASKTLEAGCAENPRITPRQKEPDSVLRNPIDALYVWAETGLVSREHLTSHINDVQLVFFTVGKQNSRELFWNKVDFFHVTWRLGDKLFSWENTLFQGIVCLDVLDVRIGQLASEKFKITLLWVFLDNFGGLELRIIFGFDLRLIVVQISNLFDYSDEKAGSVLQVRQNAQTIWQLRQNATLIVLIEHSVSRVRFELFRNLIQGCILIKVGKSFLSFFFLFFDFFALFSRLHVHKFPLGHSLRELESLHCFLRRQESNFARILFQNGGNDSLIFDWIQRAGWVRHFATNFQKFNSSIQNLNLQRMERLTVFGTPFGPFCWNFSYCSIRTARHITYDSIVSNPTIFTNFTIFVAKLRENLSLMICDDNIGWI